MKLEKAVVTTGTFDGVHVGHQTIINRLKEIALRIGGETVLMTFDPHPRAVLQPENTDLKLLSDINEKTFLLEQAGIDHLIIQPFTIPFSRKTSLEFIEELIVEKIGTTKLVIGYDHHFGRNREGSFEHLKEYGPMYGFEVEEIPAQDIDNVNVSSTKIRAALQEGDISTANLYLGHKYMLTGEVVGGDALGRKLGYPTANIHNNETRKLVPKTGVYAVKVLWNNEWFGGMLNIGIRPTVTEETITKIEVHIFNFDHSIYGQQIRVFFCARLRDEKRFESLDALKQQLHEDEKSARILLDIK